MIFTHGEEVLLEGERFVIAGIEGSPATRYRLLATSPTGPRVVWAPASALRKIDSYTRPRDDTDDVVRHR
jgi:hypothetical protein